jgi:hypothetical protein
MIIDAWAQHPTARHIQDPIFDSLRRWTRADRGGSLQRAPQMSLFETLRNMDEQVYRSASLARGSARKAR